MIERLVVSGCSYMEYYADGNGHTELAKILNIPIAINLAKSGACNDRIIRSVSRDSLLVQTPTLYLVGLTFLHRYELPICAERSDDGLWESCTGNMLSQRPSSWRTEISLSEYNSYAALRTHMFYLNESLDKTMYHVLTLINSVKQLGHRIVIFNTAESGVDQFLDESRFQLLKTTPEIVGSYKWQSIRYQIDSGAKWSVHDSKLEKYVRHVAPGEHRWLNEFLTNYIYEYKILQ